MDNTHPDHTSPDDQATSDAEGPATDAIHHSKALPYARPHQAPGRTSTSREEAPDVSSPSTDFTDTMEGDDFHTDNLSADEVVSLELISLVEESPESMQEEAGGDATEMLSAEEVEIALGLQMGTTEEPKATPAPNLHTAPTPITAPTPTIAPTPIAAPKFQIPAPKLPEVKPPAFGGVAPNPFLRPPTQDGPKRTLMGMQAPKLPSITPQPPQPFAPAPGTGANALAGRALTFGAENAYASARMPQPTGLPIDPLRASQTTPPHSSEPPLPRDPLSMSQQSPHLPAPPPEEFNEAEATEIHHGEHSSPAHLSPSHTTPPAPHDFNATEATIVGDSYAPFSPPPSPELILDGEELDDDFAEQKTEVIQSPFEQEAIMPKLRVIEGPMTGQEFILTGLRSTVGRGNNNSVMVEDLAMSRLHFEIIRHADDSYLLRDLGSANGTGLNGSRVKEAVLYHDDRLEAGKSIIKFEHAASPPRAQRHMIAVAGATLEGQPAASPQPPPSQSGPDDQTRLAALQIDQSTRMFTRVALGAGALCIPLCFLLIFAIISSSKTSEELNATATPTAEDSSPDTRRAAELFLKGAEAIKSQSWDEAQQHFEDAKRVDDGIDIGPQINRLTREKSALENLERARTLKEADQIIAAASKIPRESTYFDEAQKLIRLNRQDEVTIMHQRALAMYGEGKLDEAEATLKELATLSPEHTGIAELTQHIKDRREELAAALKKQEEEAATLAKANGIFKNSPDTSSNTSDDRESLDEGYKLYRSKKFSAAKSAFNKAGGRKGRSLASYADTVDNEWKSGTSALKTSSWSKAISALEKARAADRRVNKAHQKEIGKELAQAYGNAGNAQLNKKDYRQARKYLASGEKLGVSESTLSALSRGLEDEARKIYVQAVNKKKSDPDAALQLCRKIMLMLPSSSATYKKAQKLIFDL